MGDKKYKQSHKRKGLCIECQRPAFLPYIRCAEHLYKRQKGQMLYYSKNKEKIKAQQRMIKQERQDAGKCKDCGNVLDSSDGGADEGRVTCQNCRERICHER